MMFLNALLHTDIFYQKSKLAQYLVFQVRQSYDSDINLLSYFTAPGLAEIKESVLRQVGSLFRQVGSLFRQGILPRDRG